MPSPLYAATAAAVRKNLYVFGGDTGSAFSTAVYAYNVKRNKWTMKSPMPVSQIGARAIVIKKLIYVIGGNTPDQFYTPIVQTYDVSTDSWNNAAPMLVGKSEVSAAKIGKIIIAADGYSNNGDTGDNEAYQISTNTWSPLAADPSPRNGACTGAINHVLYVSDGNDYSSGTVNVNESYDPKTNAWTSIRTMPQPVTDMSFVVLKNQLYCIGGGSNAIPFQGIVYSNVQIFTP
jgi:N-acetylneuraminic acid mutarotase